MAMMQAFVPVSELPTTVQQPQTYLRLGNQVAEGPAAAGTTSAITAVSLGALALVAGKKLTGAQRKRRAAVLARCAEEKPFAGGLIGGESAFASGDYNFDPLGLAVRCEKYLPWFRESELKHGRICMLAWVGLVVPEVVRIPGPAPCYSASVIDAHTACVRQASTRIINGETTPDLAGPLFQVLLFCGFVEMMTTFPKVLKIGEIGLNLENAGDYQLGVNFLPGDAAKAQEMKLKELKNGRLAMLAFGGAITQAVLSGNGFPWLYASRESSSSAGLGATVPAFKVPQKNSARGLVAMRAEGYKMSKAVPFLPASPALDGYPGEEDGFDPMGFSLAVDIRWLRESELKHGRVCMLAVVGWITTDLGYRVPGEPFQVSTIEAHDAMVKFGSMPQMLCWLGYAEFFGFLAIINMMEGKSDRKPGDFGIRLLYPTDEKGQYEMQMKELRNGRLAMLAFGGIATSAVLTQSTWPFFATAGEKKTSTFGSGSALCGGLQMAKARSSTAAKAEASASLPFMPKPKNLEGLVGAEQEFDPLGFCETFDPKWLRESEIKHGRVCMLACVGFVGQQFLLFPGVPETPNSLDAVYTAPPALWATLIFASGFIESASYGGKITMLDMFEDKDKVPGDFSFGSRFLSDDKQEAYTMKLKELNNGRLAMMAIGGMVHHNLVVKGPMFPIFPEGWVGPQYTWNLTSFVGTVVEGQVGGQQAWGGPV